MKPLAAASRIRLPNWNQMRGGSLTCSAMSGSGPWTGTSSHILPREAKTRSARKRAHIGSSARGASQARRPTVGPPTATTSGPRADTTRSVFARRGPRHFSLNKGEEGTTAARQVEDDKTCGHYKKHQRSWCFLFLKL